MKLIQFVIFLAVVFFNQVSAAAPVTRDGLVIKNIHPMAVNRVSCGTACSGITRIYVNNGTWIGTNCRPDAGDLYKEDNHILSVLMMGWTTGKKIKIEVNSDDRPIDTVCKITAVFVYD